MSLKPPPVVLFGYDSSLFTLKARLALRVKQIPYTFVTVPSMMPRPILRDTFHLTYRKIPVLAIGRDVFCDTSLICEVLEHVFSDGYQSLYPPAAGSKTYRPMARGFASYWADRPLFRATCGLMPASVWRTSFGKDRAGLIGHQLDPDKLERKMPESMAGLDMHLSIIEPMFSASEGSWIFPTETPSLADVSLYAGLTWGSDAAAGRLIHNLTAGGTRDTDNEGATPVFNAQRYPAVFRWYSAMEKYVNSVPSTETTDPAIEDVVSAMKGYEGREIGLIPTPNSSHADTERKIGLVPGADVSIAPDDTGRADPTYGTLIATSPEEVVITPRPLRAPAAVDVRIHFPRLGFVVRPVAAPKL